ncbi:helix-turn-helix domain-containing protein [Neobacillus niacini]|uniref:helix-turn-helix domain-containing protein n=1 Tax=Neobacillus niacini TaxID=86668 RepID=UPI002FFF160E
MKNDNYLSVTQAAEFLGCTKEDVKKLVEDGKLTPYKAYPNDTRYVLSMVEVNKKAKKLR